MDFTQNLDTQQDSASYTTLTLKHFDIFVILYTARTLLYCLGTIITPEDDNGHQPHAVLNCGSFDDAGDDYDGAHQIRRCQAQMPPPTPLVAALSALGRDSIVGGTLGASVIIRGGSSSNSPRTTSFTVLHEKIVTAEVVVGALEALIPQR